MAASEAQHVVNVSLKKIIASRSKRGGIDLHRNLLLASVLLKARDVCIAGTYDPGYPGDYGNQHDAAVANDDELDDDVDSRQVDVTVTSESDTVPNCDEAPEKDCPEAAKGVHWDVIPDQALEEWDFLGPDICSEQLEPEKGHQQKSDLKRPSNNGNVDNDGAVTDFTVLDVADIDLRTSNHHANSISRKRTIELDVEDSDRDSYSFSSHKKQKTDASSVNCENMCMDFDDLINALEGDCSITSTAEVRETSKDFVDKLSFSLDFPITCDSDHVCSVGETNALLSCQSSANGFNNISLNDAVLSSVA